MGTGSGDMNVSAEINGVTVTFTSNDSNLLIGASSSTGKTYSFDTMTGFTLQFVTSQIPTKLTNKLGAASTQWYVRATQTVLAWPTSSGYFIAQDSNCFAKFWSWYGWTFTDISNEHDRSHADNNVLTITGWTNSPTIYIGLAKTYNSVYVDDAGCQPIWPKTTMEQTESADISAYLSDSAATEVSTSTANPYGMSSSDWLHIYRVNLSTDFTTNVYKWK